MSKKIVKNDNEKPKEPSVLTEIRVNGFKCFRDEAKVEIRPLTILAGANSSGKTSIMQPLLLMKQTLLESLVAADPLVINGPNISFSQLRQLFWQGSSAKEELIFNISLSMGDQVKIKQTFQLKDYMFDIVQVDLDDSRYEKPAHICLTNDISKNDLYEFLPLLESYEKNILSEHPNAELFWESWPSKGTLHIVPSVRENGETVQLPGTKFQTFNFLIPFEDVLSSIIHVPGIRGKPERTQDKTGLYGKFSGGFQNYVASIIYSWKRGSVVINEQKYKKLRSDLRLLKIASDIGSFYVDDTKLSLELNRLFDQAEDSEEDLVNIADVGFGVSQVLPVIVALITAIPGQIVYVEQPEIHLHPRAQFDLGKILADAANRGVLVVAETHSDLLLLGVQHQVASGQINPDKVKFHWFTRGEDGASTVSSTDLDDDGTFVNADWPEDLADSTMQAQKAFLDASFKWDE